jgi:hypothetical protein
MRQSFCNKTLVLGTDYIKVSKNRIGNYHSDVDVNLHMLTNIAIIVMFSI